MSFFEPSPVLLAFIFVQRFVYFEVLGILALLRLIAGRGWARLPAFLTLALCVAFVFATFAPALNLQGSAVYMAVAPVLAFQGGGVMPLLTSAIFAISFGIRTRRARWIDWLHVMGVLAFLGLWLATRL
jgi:hypothetical protein